MRRVLAIVLACAVACGDPVREQAVDELGEEAPGTPKGPLHRPGQPCLVCHGGEGPAESVFSIAGTVYQHPGSAAPLHDARIRFIDSAGAQYAATSNCAGNFYVGASNFDPVFPVWTKIEHDGRSAEMVSSIGRERSCAGCHQAPASPKSALPVYLVDEGDAFSQEPCP